MGWFSNLLLPGRLRTGPTVLLPARPDPKALLAVAQLADPDARFDGDDIIAGGSRILAAVELTGDILAKLGVRDEERLWACRVAAEGPLPVDFFDKSLAEGIAYRLGGWSLCRGEPTDPAEDELRGVVVYLPSAPTPEEAVPLLGELLRPAESLDSDRWPDGELVDGIVHVPVRRGVVADVYAGADMAVTIEEGHKIPPAARARWPYLTEITVAKISVLAAEAGTASESPVEGEAEPEPDGDTGTAVDAESTTHGAAESESESESESEFEFEFEDEDEFASESDGATATGPDGDFASESEGDPSDGEESLLARAGVALAIADRLQGIATDQGDFQLSEPADILPGRYA